MPIDLAVVVERRRVRADAALAGGAALLGVHGLAQQRRVLRRLLVGGGERDVPRDLARRLVERDQVRVDGRDIDLAVAEPEPAVGRPAAQLLALQHVIREVPELLARRRIEGRDARERLRHVHHAVVDERRGLEGRGLAGLVDPARRELRHVGSCDLVERREARVRVIAPVGQPVRRVLRRGEDASRVGVLRVGRQRCGGEPDRDRHESAEAAHRRVLRWRRACRGCVAFGEAHRTGKEIGAPPRLTPRSAAPLPAA